jgi:hypothetical protein
MFKTVSSKARLVQTIIFVLLPVSLFANISYLPHEVAVVRWLDKVTGRVSTFDVYVGEPAQIGSLTVEIKECVSQPIEEGPESIAFVSILDNRKISNDPELFSGWMFASSPALSALEHAVYDIWLLSCRPRVRSSSE